MTKPGFKSSAPALKNVGIAFDPSVGKGPDGMSKGMGKGKAVTVTYSQDVIDELRYMLEEEKLAGDLYEAFGDMYGLNIFDRIARSEDKHFSALVKQANKMGIDIDEILAEATGSFVNDDLQDMYDTLLAQGGKSANAALNVGISIEQTDIQDLQDAMELVTGTSLERVYGNLLNGSERHLDAFEKAEATVRDVTEPVGRFQSASASNNQEVVDELRFMLEEEKMAGDLYEAFGDLYSRKIFDRIAASEDKHFNALVNQANKMNIDIDEILFAKTGEYINDDLQVMYDTLLAKGSKSVRKALKVGVAIEKADIQDLNDAMELANSASLDRVYSNLLNGSENHLDAFQDALQI